jgi:hypothetical protein
MTHSLHNWVNWVNEAAHSLYVTNLFAWQGSVFPPFPYGLRYARVWRGQHTAMKTETFVHALSTSGVSSESV